LTSLAYQRVEEARGCIVSVSKNALTLGRFADLELEDQITLFPRRKKKR